jgi:hypothetical protein
MSKHSPDLPGWLGTARRDRSVEEPGRPGRARGQFDPQRPEGIHNRGNGSGRESERPIVAKKRGNARGAKGGRSKAELEKSLKGSRVGI